MSEESRSPSDGAVRPLNAGEKDLLRQLLKIAGWPEAKLAASETLLVSPMNDGSMGSIRFVKAGPQSHSNQMGGRIAELEFSDADNAQVIASLNVDQDGELFELDIWRTDFRPLIRAPKSGRREAGQKE